MLQIAEQGADSDRTSEALGPDPLAPSRPDADDDLRAYFRALGSDERVPSSVMAALRYFEPERLAGTLVKSVVDAHMESKRNGGVVVFAARKMACLYWVLKRAGLRVPDREQVFTDRFALLMDARAWQDKSIFLRDDTWVTGTVLRRRARRLKLYFQTLDPDKIPKIDAAAALNAEPGASPDASGWHEKSQIAVARTFATAGVPYFTDFPVSEEVVMTRQQYMSLLLALDPSLADVTNATIATDDNYAYTLSVKALLSAVSPSGGTDSASFAGLEKCAHALKLRVFVRRINGSYGVRFMPIVVLAAQRVITLLGVAETFGIDVPGAGDLERMSPEELAAWAETVEQPDEPRPGPEAQLRLEVAAEVLKQFFGYVEYLATRELFAALKPVVDQTLTEPQATQVNFTLDEDLAQFVLGRELFSKVDEHISLLRQCKLDEKSPAELRETQAPQLAGEGPIAVGDDLVIPVDNELTTLPRREPGKRIPFCELKEKCELDSWSLALALDVLNDLGRAVPDQIVSNKNGIAVVRRSYRLGEASNPLNELQSMPTSGKLARLAHSIRQVGGSWKPVNWRQAAPDDRRN